MPYYCTVPRCTSMAGKAKNVSFHQFPRDEELAKLWNKILKRGKPYTKYSKVCSLHFRPEDYTITSVGKNKGQWRTLRKDAIPSQNLPPDSLEAPMPVQRRSSVVWGAGLPVVDPMQQMAQAIYLQTMLAMQTANGSQSQPPLLENLPTNLPPDLEHQIHTNIQRPKDIHPPDLPDTRKVSYKCQECTKCFKDPDVFILHKRTHNREAGMAREKENLHTNNAATLRANPILANLLKAEVSPEMTANLLETNNILSIENQIMTTLAANMENYIRNLSSMLDSQKSTEINSNHDSDDSLDDSHQNLDDSHQTLHNSHQNLDNGHQNLVNSHQIHQSSENLVHDDEDDENSLHIDEDMAEDENLDESSNLNEKNLVHNDDENDNLDLSSHTMRKNTSEGASSQESGHEVDENDTDLSGDKNLHPSHHHSDYNVENLVHSHQDTPEIKGALCPISRDVKVDLGTPEMDGEQCSTNRDAEGLIHDQEFNSIDQDTLSIIEEDRNSIDRDEKGDKDMNDDVYVTNKQMFDDDYHQDDEEDCQSRKSVKRKAQNGHSSKEGKLCKLNDLNDVNSGSSSLVSSIQVEATSSSNKDEILKESQHNIGHKDQHNVGHKDQQNVEHKVQQYVDDENQQNFDHKDQQNDHHIGKPCEGLKPEQIVQNRDDKQMQSKCSEVNNQNLIIDRSEGTHKDYIINQYITETSLQRMDENNRNCHIDNQKSLKNAQDDQNCQIDDQANEIENKQDCQKVQLSENLDQSESKSLFNDCQKETEIGLNLDTAQNEAVNNQLPDQSIENHIHQECQETDMIADLNVQN